MEPLSRQAKLSLLIHFMYQFGSAMSGIFLTIYLWRLTSSFQVVAMYQILTFVATPLTFIAAGWWAKRIGVLPVFRWGVVSVLLFFLSILLAGEKVAVWYPVFAILNGISLSLYFTGYLTLMYEVSTESNRFRYMSLNNVIFTLAGLLGPAVAGWIILRYEGVGGYMAVFGFSFVLFLLCFALSAAFKSKPVRGGKFYLPHMKLLIQRSRDFRLSLWSFFLYGGIQGIMAFLPQLLLFEAIGREDYVGYAGAGLALLTVITGMLMSRYARPKYYRLYTLIAALAYTSAAALLLLSDAKWPGLLFMAAYSLLSPIQGNSMSSHFYAFISRMPLKEGLRIETIVVREPFVNAGRIISVGSLALFTESLQASAMVWVLLPVCALQLLIPAFLLRQTDYSFPRAERSKQPTVSRNGISH